MNRSTTTSYPFSAISGQGEMKLALLLNLVDPNIGGVYICGSRGSGKSTAVRALSEILPRIEAFAGDPYNRNPERNLSLENLSLPANVNLVIRKPIPFVDLPLGTTEDRLCGTIDIEKALTSGAKAFEPGILASVNNGILYIDEANLLDDHLVDNLLDCAASGVNTVEREGVSIRHPSKFILIGSGNPEEGELRPQLADRFGLYVDVTTPRSLIDRLQIIERRTEFDKDSSQFMKNWSKPQEKLKARIRRARNEYLPVTTISTEIKERIGQLCRETGVDGLRGDLVLTRSASAHAALHGRAVVSSHDIYCVATLCLWHRMQSDPISSTGNGNASPNRFLQKRIEKFERVSSLVLKYFPDAIHAWETGEPLDFSESEPDQEFVDDYSYFRMEYEDLFETDFGI